MVLSIQGTFKKISVSTKAALDELGIDGKVSDVKTPDEISQLDGLIIPGGESTTIGQLSLVNGSLKVLKEKIEKWNACSWDLCWHDYAIKNCK